LTTTIDGIAQSLTPLRCARCGTEGIGRYCAQCGARLGDSRDLSVKHFFKEAAAALTDFDSSLVGSFRALLARPGELTRAYLDGERHRFLPPFRVFLFCNILYFLAVAQFHTTVLTAPLRVQMDEMVYKQATRAILVKRYPALAQGATRAQRATRDSLKTALTTKYDRATEGIGKLIVVVLIPLYALLFQILFIGTGRYFAEHLVFATHLVAFFLLAIPIAGLVVIGYSYILYYGLGVSPPNGETPYVVSVLTLLGVYTYTAQRVVYGSGRVATVVRTVIVAAALLAMVVAFKFALFLVTMYWIA
jgi:hypothetical protein